MNRRNAMAAILLSLTPTIAYAQIKKKSGTKATTQKPSGQKPAADDASAVIAKIEKSGGTVMPLAQNDPHLEVDFHLAGASVTDAALAPLPSLKGVVHLHLGKTSVTDAGLVHVKPLTGLTELHLEMTKITDKGLVQIKDLKNLTYLNLYGTAVTDAGLTSLTGLTNLKNLYVWQSKVTQAGVDTLKKSLPKLDIVTGFDTAPAATPAPAPAKK